MPEKNYILPMPLKVSLLFPSLGTTHSSVDWDYALGSTNDAHCSKGHLKCNLILGDF